MLNQRMHSLVGLGDLEEAQKLAIEDPLNASMLASLNTPDKALEELRVEYANTARGNPRRRRDIGVWAGHFGDAKLAFAAMTAAIDEQNVHTAYVWLPQLAAMRQLPEFRDYLRKIGLVEYWQRYGWPEFCRSTGAHDFECR